MTNRISCAGLHISDEIYQLISNEVCPDLGIHSETFWNGVAKIISEFGPKNRKLLAKRTMLQDQIDDWHKEHKHTNNFEEYKSFLQGIGYLVQAGDDFKISPENVDFEISSQAGPQLVVPITNARFAINAANARWGSLYDALYGNDVISEEGNAEKGSDYNPVRGEKVIQYGRAFLDKAAPIKNNFHRHVTCYKLHEGKLSMLMTDGSEARLKNETQCVGYAGNPESPSSIILKNNDLHIEIQVDRGNSVGSSDLAGVKDIILESAITTIMDCEDSVATVDSTDKVLAYRNWLGLMKGDLSSSFLRNGKAVERQMNADREFVAPDGNSLKLSGRALMFVRNVGLLMTSPMVLDGAGDEVPEGIMDAIITSLIGLYDLKGLGKYTNSYTGSIYIVKPKMHGPEETAFSNSLFNAVEDLLHIPRHSIKVGVMDEERRTSVNLKECIRTVKDRVVFINTGFLDRTGDEIHTSMLAGPFLPKNELKERVWIKAYEDRNVDIGLSCGFGGKAQIGKGMWPMPDKMSDMMDQKSAHPRAGANTAWVPSPTAATLHAIHYHEINVSAQQKQLFNRTPARVDDILDIPLMANRTLDIEEIHRELENNIQGILGYVVRWIDQGIGCSKVPDINDIGLMEDRATLRISSQHIANWLEHGLCSRGQVIQILEKMAALVDNQNRDDHSYKSIGLDYSGNLAFQAASDLIFKGSVQPNGYTEPTLHHYRLAKKSGNS
jgi:malate synthase